MDLGIKGRKAIVCASSQGLGLACATSLAREGCLIFINGRDEARLDKAVAEIQAATGVRAAPVVADINTEPGRAKLVAACPEEFGDACAFLCSEQASFISGQNLQLDGGSYRGLI